MKTHNLCLLGFGNVGRALAALLVEKREALREEFGVGWRVTGIATRRLGWLVAPEGFSDEELSSGTPAPRFAPDGGDVRGWLRLARCDVLFEATALEPRTGEPASAHVRAALAAGAHVVTANKGPLVHAYAELSALAREAGRRFLFESAVADCLPVFSLFRECLPAAGLRSLRGLLNSTTGLILEEVESGRTFDEGVRRAQTLGIAEADPSYDVDGWDAAVKACALANVLFGARLGLDEVKREGIRRLDPAEVRAAHAAGTAYRLVARVSREGDGVVASVGPERLARGEAFANLEGSSLSVHYDLDVLGGLTVTAHRPDNKSTAYGMLADFLNAVRERN